MAGSFASGFSSGFDLGASGLRTLSAPGYGGCITLPHPAGYSVHKIYLNGNGTATDVDPSVAAAFIDNYTHMTDVT